MQMLQFLSLKPQKHLFFKGLLLLFPFLSFHPAPPVLQIQISGIQSAQGKIMLSVYNSAGNYMQIEKASVLRSIEVRSTQTIQVNINELPPGEYAISCYHDLNGNAKLDKNLVGIPSEPYGFSNNARPKFRAATWEETRFYLNAQGSTIVLKLENW